MPAASPSTVYSTSVPGRVFFNIDAKNYCAQEPDVRYGLDHYNFDLLRDLLADILGTSELIVLENATQEYKKRIANVSATMQKKELERLVIELSWKSSKIEGNTYTLLDTEKLLLENKAAPGHAQGEAQMIINHKNAFALAHEERNKFKTMTRANLERLHGVLTTGLDVKIGLRGTPVGVLVPSIVRSTIFIRSTKRSTNFAPPCLAPKRHMLKRSSPLSASVTFNPLRMATNELRD